MGSNTREVVTLQVGHYSNFVGTHWWNIQDSTFVYNPSDYIGTKEVDNDVFFREGMNPLGEVTYTPRLVAFDLKGSLMTLKEGGVLYDTKKSSDRSALLWRGGVSVTEAPPLTKNRFLQELEEGNNTDVMDADVLEERDERMDISEPRQNGEGAEASGGNSGAGQSEYNMDEEVTVWSDFLRPNLHPKSTSIINEYQHNSDTAKFDMFGFGEMAYNTETSRASVENKLRFFTEECDRLQGFQMLVDSYSGFGGYASALLDDIADDYSNKSITVILPTPAHFNNTTVADIKARIVNDALTYERLLKHSSMILPISLASQQYKESMLPLVLPNISYKADHLYHTSAILAANIDTLTLPYRLIRGTSHMSDLSSAMTPVGRKIVALRSSFPLPLALSLSDTLQTENDLLHCLTPGCLLDVPPYCQSVSLRGVTRANLYRSGSSIGLHGSNSTVEEVITQYMKESYMTSHIAVTSVEQSCKTVTPFPRHIFTNTASTNQATVRASDSVATMTCMESSTGIRSHIDRLKTEAKSIKLRTLPKFSHVTLEQDDFNETLECLEALCDCYSDETGDMD